MHCTSTAGHVDLLTCSVMSGSIKNVIQLLFGEDDSKSEKEAILAASILNSRKCWDIEGVKVVGVVSSDGGGGSEAGVLDWGMLVEVICTCSDTMLSKYCTQWTQQLTSVLQTTVDPALLAVVLKGVTSLLRRSLKSPQAVRDFSSHQLPAILQSCMCFSEADPGLQAAVMGVVSHALVMFPSVSSSNQRSAIRKWAAAAVFHTHGLLSQEASRVVVVQCCHSNQHWVGMVTDVLSLLESTQNELHKKSEKPRKNSSYLDPPATPTLDPMRTASLVQQMSQVSRTLCYSLLFPPVETATPPHIPLEQILNVVACGLRPPREGYTVECQVLQGATPILHTAMLNVLCTLIKTCHAHLLPYSYQITSLLVTCIHSGQAKQSPILVSAIHRTLSEWIVVAKDYDTTATPPLLRCLLSSVNHTHLGLSSLRAISVLVDSLGPLLPSPLAAAVQRVPMEHLTPRTPAEHALLLLHILRGCVTSRQVHLSPPLGATLHLLTEIGDHHSNREVADECRALVKQCCLLMHPSIAPLVTITTTPPQPLMHAQPPTPLMPPSTSHTPSPPPLMQVGTSPLMQTPRSLMQTQPPPLPLMQPSPRPLMQTQPSPLPLMKTQPSPRPLMQTQPSPLPLMQATPPIQQSRPIKRKRAHLFEGGMSSCHDSSAEESGEASGMELFVEDSPDTDDALCH